MIDTSTQRFFFQEKVKKDQYGVIYSIDGSYLVTASNATQRTRIETYHIAEGTIAICDNALSHINVPNLREVYIPSSVEYIGEYTFCSLYRLEKVVFATNSKLKVIKRAAFKNCKLLKTLSLPDSINTIGEYAFDESGITEINLPTDLIDLSTNAFVNKSTKLRIKCEGGFLYLPQSLKIIHKNAFNKSIDCDTLIIQEGTQKIEQGAFIGSRFNNVILPSSLYIIDDRAFDNWKTFFVPKGTLERFQCLLQNTTCQIIETQI